MLNETDQIYAPDDCQVTERQQRIYPCLFKNDLTSSVSGVFAEPTHFTLTSNNTWLNPWGSALCFDFKMDRTTPLEDVPTVGDVFDAHLLGHGLLDFIERVTITTADGQLISRTDNLQLLNRSYLNYELGSDYMDSVAFEAYGKKLHTQRNVMLPLPLLSAIFRSKDLLPPWLVEKLHIRIDWKVMEDNAYHVDNAVTISNQEMLLDELKFDHEYGRRKLAEYLEGGKVHIIDDITYLGEQTYAYGSPMQFTINQSFTRARKMLVKPYLQNKNSIGGTLAGVCFDAGISSYPLDMEYQLDLNGKKFPDYRIKGLSRAYHNTMISERKETKPHCIDVMGNQVGAVDMPKVRKQFTHESLLSIALHKARDGPMSSVRIDGTNPLIFYGKAPTIDHLVRYTDINQEDGLDKRERADLFDDEEYIPDLTEEAVNANEVDFQMYFWMAHETHIYCNAEGRVKVMK